MADSKSGHNHHKECLCQYNHDDHHHHGHEHPDHQHEHDHQHDQQDHTGTRSITAVLVVKGLHCADCAARLEYALRSRRGVTQAALNFNTGKLQLVYLPEQIRMADIIAVVEQLGYSVERRTAASAVREVTFRVSGVD